MSCKCGKHHHDGCKCKKSDGHKGKCECTEDVCTQDMRQRLCELKNREAALLLKSFFTAVFGTVVSVECGTVKLVNATLFITILPIQLATVDIQICDIQAATDSMNVDDFTAQIAASGISGLLQGVNAVTPSSE